MDIVFHEGSKCFHLYNDSLSYIMLVLRNGQLGQLYCGRASGTARTSATCWSLHPGP